MTMSARKALGLQRSNGTHEFNIAIVGALGVGKSGRWSSSTSPHPFCVCLCMFYIIVCIYISVWGTPYWTAAKKDTKTCIVDQHRPHHQLREVQHFSPRSQPEGGAGYSPGGARAARHAPDGRLINVSVRCVHHPPVVVGSQASALQVCPPVTLRAFSRFAERAARGGRVIGRSGGYKTTARLGWFSEVNNYQYIYIYQRQDTGESMSKSYHMAAEIIENNIL